MKILAIGDAHGKFSSRLKKEARNVDIILALGDYADTNKIRNIIFKNWTNKPWYEVVGIKKAKIISRESFKSGLKVLKELNKLNKKTFLIFGNSDFYKEKGSIVGDLTPGFYEDYIKGSKNLVLIEKKKKTLNNLDFFGFGGYVDSSEFLKKGFDKNSINYKSRIKRYQFDVQKLVNLFKNNPPKGNFIFMTHCPPFGIFDKVGLIKDSPMYGKHLGWGPYNQIIKKYKPKLVLCAHMHEYQGVRKIGKSIIINPGCAAYGKFAIIDWPSLKVKFYR